LKIFGITFSAINAVVEDSAYPREVVDKFRSLNRKAKTNSRTNTTTKRENFTPNKEINQFTRKDLGF